MGVVGGNMDNAMVVPPIEDKEFAMFSSPETKEEEKEVKALEKEEQKDEKQPKRMTLMLARPLKYFQMGMYAPHIDAGNPALIIPIHEGKEGTFETRKVYAPFTTNQHRNMIPIYNKNGKKIASVVSDPAFKSYQGDTHDTPYKRQQIVHHLPNTPPQALIMNQTNLYLAAAYSFDEFIEDRIIDITGNGNDGTLQGAATLMRTNFSCGMACRLFGGSVMVDGSKFTPKPSLAVTVATWVKIHEILGKQTIFSVKGFAHPLEETYHLGLHEGKLKWMHINEQKHVVFDCETVDAAIKPDEWVHVTGTYDSGESMGFKS